MLTLKIYRWTDIIILKDLKIFIIFQGYRLKEINRKYTGNNKNLRHLYLTKYCIPFVSHMNKRGGWGEDERGGGGRRRVS